MQLIKNVVQLQGIIYNKTKHLKRTLFRKCVPTPAIKIKMAYLFYKPIKKNMHSCIPLYFTNYCNARLPCTNNNKPGINNDV